MGLTVWFNISLDPERDKDIVAALDKARNRSDFVRKCIRSYLSQPKAAETLEAIRDLEAEVRRLRLSGVKPVGDTGSELIEDEPEEAARNLDGLLSRLEAGVLDVPSPDEASGSS